MQQEQIQPLKEDISASDITLKEATVKDGDGNTVKTEQYASIQQTVEVKLTEEQAKRNIDQLKFAKQQALDSIDLYDKQIAANQVVVDSFNVQETETKQTAKQ